MTSSQPTDRDVDRRALRDIVARADAAQTDPAALLALHTPDVALVNIAGRRVLDEEELASAMTAALSSSLRDVRTTVEVEDIRFPGPDVAVVSCLKTVHDERVDADRTALPVLGALTYVLVRSGGDWRIALAQTTAVVS